MKWIKVDNAYHSEDCRFIIKREPGTKNTWVLTETGIDEHYIHYRLRDCKKYAEEVAKKGSHICTPL